MKTKWFLKISMVICLCAIFALSFVACRDKEIYAETSDFESYPDYWNDFNEEIYVPDQKPQFPGETPDLGETDDETASDNIDTDGDGTPNKTDPDIDGDDIPNKDDPDIDGDNIPNEEDPDIDGDDIPNGGDGDEDGTIGNDSDKNEGPFVPYKP